MAKCVIWPGAIGSHGYGVRWFRGKLWLAHRAAWVEARGPIPDGMMLDHVCRVRACCNPDHLRVVTPRQNTLENSKGRSAIHAAKSECPKCGGPYTQGKRKRRCKRCENAARNARRAIHGRAE